MANTSARAYQAHFAKVSGKPKLQKKDLQLEMLKENLKKSEEGTDEVAIAADEKALNDYMSKNKIPKIIK